MNFYTYLISDEYNSAYVFVSFFCIFTPATIIDAFEL